MFKETTESTSSCRALAINLLVSERRILTKVKTYCDKRVDKVKTKQNLAPLSAQPAPEPMSITEMDEDEEEEHVDIKTKVNETVSEVNEKTNVGEAASEDPNVVQTNTVKIAEDNLQNGINDLSEDLGEMKVAE